MDRSSKQNINKETVALNDTLDQMDLTDIIRTFHTNTAKYILFKCTQNILQNGSHIGPQNKSYKFKKTEVMIISINAEKILDKVQHSFMIQTLTKV